MIHIYKDFDNPPKELNGKTIKKAIKVAILNRNADNIENRHYNPGKVKEALEIIYKEKCGYCESKVKHCATLQVEHYRPKNKVDDQDSPTDGYYWLASEWSNLLLSCPRCNQQGAKGNKFPLHHQGIRVSDHILFLTNGELDSAKCNPGVAPLSNERPLLLNPEISSPNFHFYYDNCGRVFSQTEEGNVTIQVCQLYRPDLIEARKEKIDQVVVEFKNTLAGVEVNGVDINLPTRLFTIFKNMESSMLPEREYSLLRKDIYHRFNEIILPLIDRKFHKLITDAFNKYKRSKS